MHLEDRSKSNGTLDPSGFVLLADYIPGMVQEIHY